MKPAQTASPRTAARRTGGWNLTELASGPRDPRLAAQIRLLEEKASEFESERRRISPAMSNSRFKRVLDTLAEITEMGSRVGGYASLLHAADTQSDEATSLLMRMEKLGSDISNRTLFFGLWWKRGIDAENAERLASGSGELAEYLRHKRRLARYSLSEPEEKIINTLDVTGASALVNLYDKITNAYQYRLRISKRARTMTREEISNYVRSASPRLRKAAYVELLSKYDSEKGVTGQIYQNIVQNWADETVGIRGYESPISARNVGNNLDDRTVDSLLAACQKNAPLFQKFFRLKAKMLGMKRLRRYDIYAPATGTRDAESKRHAYGAAVRMVTEALDAFSPDLGAHARRVIGEGHVDSATRRGKRDGAFCSTISPKITPYILLSYTGRTRDVFTLAHEMGHAVHSMAAGSRSILVQHAPLPLAETASTFSELLLYDHMEGSMPDSERLGMLAEKADDLYATIMRQAYFTVFEIAAHGMIAGGSGAGAAATIGEVSGAYMRNLQDQFGRSVDVSDDFAAEWICIPHFYHTPFYCYAYSFGNLLSLSLYQRYRKEGPDFAKSYVEILAAGGSRKPEDLMASYGFDISSQAFWLEGFEYVSGQIRQIESLA